MKTKMKVAIFSDGNNDLLQAAINEWIESQSLGPADIQKIAQSESSETPTYHSQVTISIWYIQHYDWQDDPKIVRHAAAIASPGSKVDASRLDGWWLTDDLPQTNPPANTRPGAEYGVE